MPSGRTCSVCPRPDVVEIDKALVSGEFSFSDISQRFGPSRDALWRHKAHLPRKLAREEAATSLEEALDVVANIKRLDTTARFLLSRALRNQDAPDTDLALKAWQKLFALTSLMLEVAGELQTGRTVNIFNSPQFLALQAILVKKGQDDPEIAAVLEELAIEVEELEATYGP